MVDGYTAVYNQTQAGWAMKDIIGGIFAGVAGLAETYGLAAIALMILGSLFAIFAIMKRK